MENWCVPDWGIPSYTCNWESLNLGCFTLLCLQVNQLASYFCNQSWEETAVDYETVNPHKMTSNERNIVLCTILVTSPCELVIHNFWKLNQASGVCAGKHVKFYLIFIHFISIRSYTNTWCIHTSYKTAAHAFYNKKSDLRIIFEMCISNVHVITIKSAVLVVWFPKHCEFISLDFSVKLVSLSTISF